MVSMLRTIYHTQLIVALGVHILASSILIRKPNAGIPLVWECVSLHAPLHVQLPALEDVLIMHLKIVVNTNPVLVEDVLLDVLPTVLGYVAGYVKDLVLTLAGILVKHHALITANGNVVLIVDPVVHKVVPRVVLDAHHVLDHALERLIKGLVVLAVDVQLLVSMIVIRIASVGVVDQYVVLNQQVPVKLTVD